MCLTNAVSRACCLAACFAQSVFQTALSTPRPDEESPVSEDDPASSPSPMILPSRPLPEPPPASIVAARDPAARPPAPGDSLLVGSGLVGTMLRRSTNISLRPHLGDLLHEDYLSVAVSTRHGITDAWEASCAVNVYFGHGLGAAPLFSDPGISELRLGTRYQLTEEPDYPVGCALGLNYSRPVGHPPESLLDPYEHVTPYVIVSRKLADHPGWTTFVRAGLDFVTLKEATPAGDRGGLRDDSWFVAPAVNREHGDWSYTLATRFASTAGLGEENECRITLAPSISWKLPADWTPGRKGRWVLGLGLSATFGDGEPDLGVRGSLRTDFDLRNLFRKHRAGPAKPRSPGRRRQKAASLPTLQTPLSHHAP